MPGVLENFDVTLESDRSYLVILCFLKDSVAEGNDGEKLLKLDLFENTIEIIQLF